MMVVPVVTAQSTPFVVYGHVFERDDNPCNGSTVQITNLNTGASEYAENSSGSHYYQQILNDTVNAGDPLRIQVTSPDGIQSNIVEHTVTAENITTGGMFNINITLTYPDQQSWYLTSTAKPEDAPFADDGLTNVTDNLMQKGSRSGSLGDSFNITYPEVAWFYADVGAESDIGFGENPWEAHILTEHIVGPRAVNKNLTVEVCRLAKDTGEVTVIASHTEQFTPDSIANATIEDKPYLSWNITCEDTGTTQDFSTDDWLAVRLSWDSAAEPLKPLRIYYQPEAGMDSYIGSPYSDPGYPIPELSTMILFGMGLLMIVGYVGLRRRSLRSK
jgi:hypothetical protein